MLVHHDFGTEGLAYVRRYLEANRGFGKLLGAALLRSQGIDEGLVWAFVPAEPRPERRAPLDDFESGGLYPTRDPAWADQFGLWLDEVRGDGQGSSIICVEGALHRPSDQFLDSQPEIPVFFCGESVYFYETGNVPAEQVRRWLGGATWKPDVGIVTERPTSLDEHPSRQWINRAVLAELATRTKAVVIGAWDGEGLVFWEPARKHTR